LRNDHEERGKTIQICGDKERAMNRAKKRGNRYNDSDESMEKDGLVEGKDEGSFR